MGEFRGTARKIAVIGSGTRDLIEEHLMEAQLEAAFLQDVTCKQSPDNCEARIDQNELESSDFRAEHSFRALKRVKGSEFIPIHSGVTEAIEIELGLL